MNNFQETNLNALSFTVMFFIVRNGLPLNSGFEEAVADVVMGNIVKYYDENDMDFDLSAGLIDDDAIDYAFGKAQMVIDEMQNAVAMMMGGGLS